MKIKQGPVQTTQEKLKNEDIFNNISTVHTHNLRNSESNDFIPRPRTEYAKGSPHYRGSVLIPLEIRHLPSF